MDRAPLPGLILQHGLDSPPGLLGEWLDGRGIEYSVHSTWLDPLPDDPAELAWIASLGSEHTPTRVEAPGWVENEVDFLRRALDARVPVLGLCFGGQALAAAAGARVNVCEPPEIGWMEVATIDEQIVPRGPWLHYHYDLFEPPAGARTIARSGAGPAAFTLDGSLGLQFHPESTPEIAADWARQDVNRLEAIGIDPVALAEQGARLGAASEEAARRLFDGWWARVRLPREVEREGGAI